MISIFFFFLEKLKYSEQISCPVPSFNLVCLFIVIIFFLLNIFLISI